MFNNDDWGRRELRLSVHVEQANQRDVQGFCKLEQVQVGRISSPRLQPTDV